MPEEKNIEEQPDEQRPATSESGDAELLKKKISELELSLAQIKDQLLRKAAEFENYKRRTENDYANTVKYSNEELIASLLPVLDDVRRSLKMVEKTGSEQNAGVESQKADQSTGSGNGIDFVRGIELIYNKFLKILEDEGVTQFDSVGKIFDPGYHDALLQMPRNDVPPHTVIEEVEKGYLFHGKVIRHAKVIVSGEMSLSEEASKSDDSSHAHEHNDERESN